MYREEDLDRQRFKEEFRESIRRDLNWLGVQWTEGPLTGGTFGPYRQSERGSVYKTQMSRLANLGLVYPTEHSRKDIESSAEARSTEGEWIFPGSLRNPVSANFNPRLNWRFVVPKERVSFLDEICGKTEREGQVDFGDFLVWRKDGIPSYEFAVVVDDALMKVSEVVRGADLLTSTARQLLLYNALGWEPPKFAHCPLVLGDDGTRLSKTKGSLGLSFLREKGMLPEDVFELAKSRLSAPFPTAFV